MQTTVVLTKADELARQGVLLVLRGPHVAGPIVEEPASASPQPKGHDLELFVVVDDAGNVTAYNGHVDLGTGIGTALAQIVADELDVALDRVTMVLGHSALVPNQGATIASETIQVTAIPLRQAAAQARHHLVGLAAERLGVRPDDLAVENGIVRRRDGGNAAIGFGELLQGRQIRLLLSTDTVVKDVADYRLVGRSTPRIDIPAKATGSFTYVHDVRVPGMLHGRVVRPPYAGVDAGPFVGTSLIGVDENSIADIPGIVAVVVIGDFIGIVAEREENAVTAAERLKTHWKPWPGLPDLEAPEAALRANPSKPRVLLDRGNVEKALAEATTRMPRTYVWPYQMHAAIGPSCSVADVRPDGMTLWSGTQNPLMLRTDLSRLLGLPETAIAIIRHEAAGCYGRNCADDVGADAALLSRAVGRPVRVQLSREQEHAWEPKGTAQVMDVDGGLTAAGEPAAYDFATRYPSNGSPTLALLLTGTIPPVAAVFEMGDRTAIPPYRYDHARVTVHDMAPIARASWLRGVSSMPNSFAHESYIDELATEAGVDPIDYRLRYLDDPRAIDLVRAVAARGDWQPHSVPQTLAPEGDILRGRGFAYACYVHGKFPGTAAASSAWIADVAVNRVTGEVDVTRVVVGQDSGLMINPAGVEHQIHGNVIQSTSRVLKEQVTFDHQGGGAVTSREWGAYPIITFPKLPAIDVLMVPRPNDPPLGVGESASVPSAAAIANAIFDATGVRFREPPFTPERVRAVLNQLPPPVEALTAETPRRNWFGSLVTGCVAAAGVIAAISVVPSPWRGAIPPIPQPDPAVYSSVTIEHGRIVAALGDCAVCHAGPGGGLSGGKPIATPFGTVTATNITPDLTTGIGSWSYPAFERAMRDGVSRDGHYLYPAHPYTSFTKASEADLQALYAYVMAQPAVAHEPPTTTLRFPFNLRPLMAGWNALFLKPGPLQAEPTRSDQWNRGRSLVEGLGHCGACHSPRNALGAEQGGAQHLAGAFVEGWEAPSLTALSRAPIPWTEDELFAYLSTGQSRHHGVAAGPMAAVVSELGTVPAADLRAMAHYLASFQTATPTTVETEALAETLAQRTATAPLTASALGGRLYDGACAMCHEAGGPVLFGARPALALNTNVHSASPDNLARVVLHGIAEPAHADLGAMPGFAGSFSDQQAAELLRYIRARFAPDQPAWTDLETTIARVRTADAPH
ncbi:molybdopterin-dependent oxidoreductase [Lichenihabitans sp. PAMC28606]|uniref:molybdopterin cofactor-binding domain-containing protein n=1 Tax=Lichenihabitans sp. PAMC28606 TaxID=2880932 RepID=UPI001D0A8316|nr:molybdopterin cofactor-binding domain-containing protein [Lichenihabitans sp. PAMC28606]UDL96011.1 molybdopterin-dependent oxidoreductase [Lichenihabitans sp. PAMC28606]